MPSKGEFVVEREALCEIRQIWVVLTMRRHERQLSVCLCNEACRCEGRYEELSQIGSRFLNVCMDVCHAKTPLQLRRTVHDEH